MRLALIGLGLIGGSIARAVRSGPGSPFTEVVAWSPGGQGPAAAANAGIIDRAAGSLEAAVDQADVVVLAADPLSCLDLLDRVAALGVPAAAATITDVASTKGRIVERASQLGLPFVGGHPMAGLETRGFESSRPDLFRGRPWVLCPAPGARPVDRERAEALVGACGAEVQWLDPLDHDRAVAAISHLPLAVAASLVEAVAAGDDWPLAQILAAGGWASATRLARGDPAMGAGIAATNAPEIAVHIRAFRRLLDAWLADLEATPDDARATAGRIRARLEAARDTLRTAD